MMQSEFTQSPAFEDWTYLMNVWQNAIKKAGKETLDWSGSGSKIAERISGIIRGAAPDKFELVGEGSSRIVFRFVCDPRFALKVAKSAEGHEQNEVEVRNSTAGDYECFARIIDWDKVNCMFLVLDFCKESTPADWQRITGLPIDGVMEIVSYALGKRCSLRKISEQCDLDWNEMDPDFAKIFPANQMKAVKNFCDNAISSDKKKWKVFRDMIRFYFDNGNHAMLLSDMGGYANWGVLKGTTPDEDAIVIIDSGLGN